MGSVELAPCPAGQLGQLLGVEEFLCGQYEVFENRRAASGRKIALAITVVPALDPDPDGRDAPVFPLAGGPGESAHNTMLGAYFALQPGMGNRDMVVVDIRGTGGSNPLQCSPLGPADAVQSWVYYIPPLDEVRACAEALAARADLTQYTTTYAADDIDEVRRAMGFDRFALVGASYGTVLAQQILRRHGEAVDAAILLAIGPVGMHAPRGFASSLERTRQRLMDDCEAIEACRSAYPTFREDFEWVLDHAREAPVSAEVINPTTGQPETVELAYGDFVMGIRFLLYNTQQAATIPNWMDEARGGDFAPLMQAIAGNVYAIRQVLYYGLFQSMRCAEDLPFVDVEAERADAAGTMLGTYRLDRELENCSVWPRAELVEERHAPVSSDARVLLLSGSEDPVTPPEYGDLVAETLSNALHVVFENRGHGFFDPAAIGCLHTVVVPFLAGRPLGEIDVTCARELERLPFHVGSP
jgi:pimeloyl-ACP methyl ester carboxylesterase